jgi:AAA+ superfamily predicted ATPase
MQLAKYLMCVAARHEKAKNQQEEESRELWLKGKKCKGGRPRFTLTYKDEAELLKGVIDSVSGKPSCLKPLTLPALGSLAYILKAKMASDPYIQGQEIMNKLVCDPELIFVYLESFAELEQQGWIRLIETPGMGFTDQPPFSWLQSCIEFGDTFHREMELSQQNHCSFTSNDTYLDTVFAYLQTLIQDGSKQHRVNDPETDLATFQPLGWFRRIAMGEQNSTCALPAAETRKKYSLSVFQHLTLIGLLGMRDGDVNFDFSDPSDVTQLYAIGRICRKRMKEHLFGEKSPLMRQVLMEGIYGSFGESVQLTQLGLIALLGKHSGKITPQDLKNRVKKSTLFDIEEPKVNKESLLLPQLVMEAVRSLVFSESPKGRQIRKSWQLSLPTAWGSPTGTTVLLYGPPGTGKTLTAQYLASELKLPLLKIDAARVLSCWVGGSEQNVRRIFDDYALLQKELGATPVLLLNEADQLLSAREAGGNAVDRMNNNMQNLFLEGLERFSGILVATTNRRDLLDEAFSRRLTYKLGLPPPDRNLRIELWKGHLPLKRLAHDVDITQLAELGLTGGEIRLVIERAVRLQAYRGITMIDGTTLMEIAREELAGRMYRDGSMARIGFAVPATDQKGVKHEIQTGATGHDQRS